MHYYISNIKVDNQSLLKIVFSVQLLSLDSNLMLDNLIQDSLRDFN